MTYTLSETIFHSFTRTVSIGERRSFTVEAKLHSLGGQPPYFSVTGEERNLRRRSANQVEACGCMHDEVLRYFPKLAPVVRVHLSDEHGVPMHAEANAIYWAGIGRYSEANAVNLSNHLRIPAEEAEGLIAKVASLEENVARLVVANYVNDQSPRWQAEADEAIAILRAQDGLTCV